MTLSDAVTRTIVTRLLNGQDYRIEIINLLNAKFFDYVIAFFKKIIAAKLDDETITIDWYKEHFLNPELSSDDILNHSGLNKKTVSNMYNSARREIVLDVSVESYERLVELIKELADAEPDIDVTLTLKLKKAAVDLTLSETLIVINAIAVRRSSIRGGLWSTAGKRVEEPLMHALCRLHRVPEANYTYTLKGEQAFREVDFYLIDPAGKKHKCEMKLMGKGNPESADAVIARDSSVFVADKLSDRNKQQLDNLGVEWVELRQADGYKRFATVLNNLSIPFKPYAGNLDTDLPAILDEIFKVEKEILGDE
jgi:hypothetical protein